MNLVFICLVLVLLKLHTAFLSRGNLTCTTIYRSWDMVRETVFNWTLGDVTPSSLSGLVTKVTWSDDFFDGTCLDVTDTSCRCYDTDVCSSMVVPFTFNVTVTSDDGTMSVSGSWFVDPMECVKPVPVDDVTSVSVSPNCVRVKWRVSKYLLGDLFNSCKAVFQVLHKQHGQTHAWATDKNCSSYEPTSGCGGECTVCELSPFTTYDFGVRYRKCNDSSISYGHYSDVKLTATVRTNESAPSAAPEMHKDGYFYTNTECPRKVVLFWKDIPRQYKNGIITHFQLTLTEKEANSTSTLHVTGKEYTAVISVSCSKRYVIDICAMTSAGTSRNCSQTEINTKDNSSITSVIPEVTKRGLNVFWNISGGNSRQGDINNITVFYCQRDISARCKSNSEIKWLDVSKENNPVHVAISDPTSVSQYRVGVAYGSGGIVWADCLYAPKGSASIFAYDPTIHTEDLAEGSALIKWNTQACDNGNPGPYVAGFILTVCPRNSEKEEMCKDSVVNVTLPGMASNYLLKDLDTQFAYRMELRPLDRTLTAGDPMVVYGEPAINGTFPTWLIAILVVFGIAVVSLCSFFFIKVAKETGHRLHNYIEDRRAIATIKVENGESVSLTISQTEL
ncbi:uncharacterized protein LOC128213082 isoform X2 [Mya arenaria]|uniref:uncharacterized protein LOC128213082 isoform X2 n=1 Tax=Mya arenaria TaxID=6604 RepID=UPI0022E68994|nr:uncharacterized protein LOC128213082 isoform X2 [Mya arenaria]